jgi:hypothetical protein
MIAAEPNPDVFKYFAAWAGAWSWLVDNFRTGDPGARHDQLQVVLSEAALMYPTARRSCER